MIIAMDSEQVRQVTQLGRMYRGENICRFTSGVSLTYNQEVRLTFVGHAETETFGEHKLSPKNFAQHLIDHGLSNDKEVIIDLLGCSIGDINDKTSYARSVAKYLYQQGFVNIKVNALNALVTNEAETYSQTFIQLPSLRKRSNREEGLGASNSSALSGIRKEDYANFLQEYRNNPDYDKVIRKYRKVIYSTDDVRFSFDNNENFQITSKNIEMPDEKRAVLAIINNRIAELKEEIHFSSIRKITGYTSEAKVNKLNELIKLKTKLENMSLDEIPTVIQTVLASKKIATPATLTCLTAMSDKAKTLLDKQQYEKMQEKKADISNLMSNVEWGAVVSPTDFFNSLLRQDKTVFQLALIGQKSSSLRFIQRIMNDSIEYKKLDSNSDEALNIKYLVAKINDILTVRGDKEITDSQQNLARQRMAACLNDPVRSIRIQKEILNSLPPWLGEITHDLDRNKAEEMLSGENKTEGTFLIRPSDTHLGSLVLSYLSNNEIKHHLFHLDNGTIVDGVVGNDNGKKCETRLDFVDFFSGLTKEKLNFAIKVIPSAKETEKKPDQSSVITYTNRK